jgi:hypothetical protein
MTTLEQLELSKLILESELSAEAKIEAITKLFNQPVSSVVVPYTPQYPWWQPSVTWNAQPQTTINCGETV